MSDQRSVSIQPIEHGDAGDLRSAFEKALFRADRKGSLCSTKHLDVERIVAESRVENALASDSFAKLRHLPVPIRDWPVHVADDHVAVESFADSDRMARLDSGDFDGLLDDGAWRRAHDEDIDTDAPSMLDHVESLRVKAAAKTELLDEVATEPFEIASPPARGRPCDELAEPVLRKHAGKVRPVNTPADVACGTARVDVLRTRLAHERIVCDSVDAVLEQGVEIFVADIARPQGAVSIERDDTAGMPGSCLVDRSRDVRNGDRFHKREDKRP